MLSLCQIITVAAAFGEQGEETHTQARTQPRACARAYTSTHAQTLKKKHTLAHTHTACTHR